MRVESRRVGWLRGERVRRGAWASLAASSVLTALLAAVAVPVGARVLGIGTLLGLLAMAGSAVGVAASSRLGSTRRRGEVSIEGDQIVVASGGRVTRRPLVELQDGWIEEPGDVILRWKDGAVLAVDAEDGDRADGLLAAAGVAATHRALAVRLSSGASRVALGVPLSVAGVSALAPAFLFMMMVVGLGVADLIRAPTAAAILGMLMILFLLGVLGLLITSLLDAVRAPEAVVGIDGIRVRRLLDDRFISHRDVHSVEEGPRGVILRTARGPIELSTWRRGGPLLDTPDGVASPAGRARGVLAERIRDAKSAGTRGSASIAALDRGGRTLAAWRDEVRALARGKGAYRQAGLGPSELGDVVLDATAPAERRIAAAMALGAAEEPAHRDRVRIAIESCADAELKAALEQAAADELEEAVVEKVIARR